MVCTCLIRALGRGTAASHTLHIFTLVHDAGLGTSTVREMEHDAATGKTP